MAGTEMAQRCTNQSRISTLQRRNHKYSIRTTSNRSSCARGISLQHVQAAKSNLLHTVCNIHTKCRKQSAKVSKLLFGIESNIIHGIKAIYAIHSSYFDDIFYGEKQENLSISTEMKEEDFEFPEIGTEKNDAKSEDSPNNKKNNNSEEIRLDLQTEIERDMEGKVTCVHIRNIDSNVAFVFLSDLFHNCGPVITCHNVLG